jgi:glutamine synthetase
VTGEVGAETVDANAEVKVFDATANPYLAVGCVIAAGLSGIEAELRLPAEVTVDPATLNAQAQPPRLPTSLAESVAAFETSDTLHAALGSELFETIIAVRRAEIDRFDGATEEAVVAATRWRH